MATYKSKHTGQKVDSAVDKAHITGPSDPTSSTVGVLGQRYFNTVTLDVFECIGASADEYEWRKQASGIEIINNLNETTPGKVLDASQGKILKDSINTKLDKTATPNRNLLHNWDFRNPVNQRAQANYTSQGYTIDRWSMSADGTGSLEVIAGQGIRLKKISGTYAVIAMRIEPSEWNQLIGKTLTISLEIGGIIHTAQIAPVTPEEGYRGSGFSPTVSNLSVGYMTFPQYGQIQIVLEGAGTIQTGIISRAKFELGTVSTLANDPPADFGEQLTLCMRYYERSAYLNSWIGARQTVALRADWLLGFYFVVPKRIAPTVTLYSRQGNANKVSNISDGTEVGTNVYVTGSTALGTSVTVDSGAGFVAGQGYDFGYEASADL